MVFDSLTFAIFFAVLTLLYFGGRASWRLRKGGLLVASYLFYMAWDPLFSLLLVFSTVVDWFAAKGMTQATSGRQRKVWLLVSLGSNLGLLAFFKYSFFFAETAHTLAGLLGWGGPAPAFSLVLPVGISFYTFQTLSYSIDVYRGELETVESPLDFALFVSFFPQLVAGPIVRAADFLPQLRTPKAWDAKKMGWGMMLLVLGLFEKVVLADMFMAPVADLVYNTAGPYTALDAWVGTAAFTAQIFFDFAGYSTCAIGTALCLGFELPDNFKFPYSARGFSDFWRRWHISLSTWLRDYLYISLGGNRQGRLRTHLNLFLTMLLGGLWHGASFSFMVWGALHGTYLIVERWVRPRLDTMSWTTSSVGKMLGWGVTLVCVMVAWVFFRAQTLGQALIVVKNMVGQGNAQTSSLLGASNLMNMLVVFPVMLGVQVWMRDRTLRDTVEQMPPWAVVLGLVVMMVLIATANRGDHAFLYFQF